VKSIKERSVIFMEKGNYFKAESLLKNWFSTNPFDAQGLYLLLVTLDAQNKSDECIALLKNIIFIELHAPNLCFDLAFFAFKHFEDEIAFKLMFKGVELEPHSLEKWNELGARIKAIGRIEIARDIYLKLCEAEFASTKVKALAFFNLGVIAQENHNSELAIFSFQNALDLNPNFVNASMNLGNELSAVNRLDEALSTFDRAIEVDPNSPWLHFNKSLVLEKLRKLDEAIESLKIAQVKEPQSEPILLALGSAYLEVKDFKNALICCEKVLIKNPSDVASLTNKGIALQKTYQLNDALRSLISAFVLDPSNIEPLINLGNVFKEMGETYRARVFFEYALSVNSQNVKVRTNLALIDLQLARYSEGWSNYDWRWQSPDFASRRLDAQIPLWEGNKDQGHLLLWAEQGIGDEVMFGSLIPEAQALVGNISVLMDQRLISLFKRTFPGVAFYDQKLEVPSGIFDFQCPLGSLPRIFRSSQESFQKHQTSYLIADGVKVSSLRARLAPKGQKIVGLSWFSNSRETGFLRSIDLKLLLQSLTSKGIKENIVWVCLQYGEVQKEIQECRDQLGVSLIVSQDIDNFNDLDGLANLISACDSIVSIDNSTVMLSASLGVKTQVLLPLNADWRWGEKDVRSFWFPDVQVYRKRDLLDWSLALHKLGSDFQVA
jgi:tetratricopeptide (TPR) repeat protein